MSNACTEILATHGNRVLCEQDIKTTITRSHVVWVRPGRGVYWLEFALTICSAWSGHKFTAHLICDFVSLSLYAAGNGNKLKQLYTIWNYTFNTKTHTHTHKRAFCLHIFINLRTETAPPRPRFAQTTLCFYLWN